MDPELLQQALVAVTRRHELLRASFMDRDGKLVQSIGTAGSLLNSRPLESSSSLQSLIQVGQNVHAGFCFMSIYVSCVSAS